jgi:hypothetical protein
LETVWSFLPNLKTIALFLPIAVRVEDDATVSLPIFCLDNDGWSFAKSLKDLTHRAFVFGCQCLRKREFEDILDVAEVSEIVREPIVVLYPSVDAVEESDDLVCIQVYPS